MDFVHPDGYEGLFQGACVGREGGWSPNFMGRGGYDFPLEPFGGHHLGIMY